MNRSIVLPGLTALALGALPSAQAIGSAFIRPIVAYVSPEAAGYDAAGYIGISAGATVGETRQHEFSGEIGGTSWEFDEHYGSAHFKGTETYVPILASYRYYFQPTGAKVRIFISPSIGFTQANYEVEVSGPGIFQKDDSTEVLATLAASAGIDISFNARLSLNVGYRYLYIDGGETELLGANVTFDASKAHVVFAALNIRL